MAIQASTNGSDTFPEDIERIILEMLLSDARDMCGTMSLVSSRFYLWAKPITFRTAVVRRRDDWTKRMSDLLVPNASFIQILAIEPPLTRVPLTEDELGQLQRLLVACCEVKHLAVPWTIWRHFPLECGSLQLESLYLVWDGEFYIPHPSLSALQYPSALKDLTVYAPPDLQNPTPFQSEGLLYIPETTQCVNLEYMTYAANRIPGPFSAPWLGKSAEIPEHIRGVMFVLVDRSEKFCEREKQERQEREDQLGVARGACPWFSTAYLRLSSQVLGQWVEKVEGNSNLLDHSSACGEEVVYWGLESRPSEARVTARMSFKTVLGKLKAFGTRR